MTECSSRGDSSLVPLLAVMIRCCDTFAVEHQSTVASIIECTSQSCFEQLIKHLLLPAFEVSRFATFSGSFWVKSLGVFDYWLD